MSPTTRRLLTETTLNHGPNPRFNPVPAPRIGEAGLSRNPYNPVSLKGSITNLSRTLLPLAIHNHLNRHGVVP